MRRGTRLLTRRRMRMLEKSWSNPLLFAKKRNGIWAVIEKVNNELLPSPNDNKLTTGAVMLVL